MKYNQIITEMPQLIASLDHHDIKQATDTCLHNINASTLVHQYDENSALYELTLGGSGYYFITDESKSSKDKIVYFVQYRTIELGGNVLPSQSTRQVLVWRDRDSFYTGEVAVNIFWKKLFPRFNCLTSDSQQTPDGKRFWMVAVKHAFDNGYQVRVINSNDNTFKDVNSLAEFTSLEATIWGSANWFQRVIIAIFK